MAVLCQGKLTGYFLFNDLGLNKAKITVVEPVTSKALLSLVGSLPIVALANILSTCTEQRLVLADNGRFRHVIKDYRALYNL